MEGPKGQVCVGSVQGEAGKAARLQNKGEMRWTQTGKRASRAPERKVRVK